MKTIKKILCVFLLGMFGLINLSPVLARSPYDQVLGTTTRPAGINESSLYSAINGDGKGDVVTDAESGSDYFNKQILEIIGYVIDIFIVVGIAVAFFGGYNIMTSEKEETMKEGVRLVIFGILGIIIMVSAKFLASSLVGESGIIQKEFWNAGAVENTPNGIQFADNLYNNIMYPFIKMALYFVVGVLFFIMAGKVIGFVTATDDKAKTKAAGIIIRCVVGILIIMGSKQIVEAVMGKQDDVLKIVNEKGEEVPARIDEQGNPIGEFGSIPLIAQIINWVMTFTALIVLILVIIQGYKILTKPDDPKTRESMKKAIIYMFVGLLVIGASYVISNVLVLNNVPLEIESVSSE